MPYHSVLFSRLTINFATVLRHASRGRSTVRATSLALTNGFLILGVLHMVREILLAHKTSITFSAVYSEGREIARRPSHTITTCLVTAMYGVSSACFVTCFTHVLLRHRARYIHDHVIVPFDIIIE